MDIRALESKDIEEIRRIHSLFFRDEFDFPDFLKGYLCAFVVTNEKEEILVAAGVRTIAESVIVTNKSAQFDSIERRNALLRVLDASQFVCRETGYDQLHAFIQDENWLRHLERYNFRPTKGQSLVLDT